MEIELLVNSSSSGDDGNGLFSSDGGFTGEGEGDKEKLAVVWRIAFKIIGPGVVGIGLLGNVLNLIVLSRPSMKGVTYKYLIGLACSDIIVLLCAIPMMFRMRDIRDNSSREYSWVEAFFYAYLEYPLANCFQASSIFIVICLTIDRFVSVCLPTRFKSLHTNQNARTAMTIAYIIAIMISLPLSLINRIVRVEKNATEPLTSDVGVDADLETPMSSGDPAPIAYTFEENSEVTKLLQWNVYLWCQEVIVRFGPAVILLILNVNIIHRFREIKRKRREMLRPVGHGQHGNGNSPTGNPLSPPTNNDQLILQGEKEKISKRKYKEEKKLVTLLTGIVVLFFITITPVMILNITYSEALTAFFPYQVFRAVANVLELCNYALNFYIYFLCSKEFRNKFLSFFTLLCPLRQNKENDFQSVAVPLHEVSASSRVPVQQRIQPSPSCVVPNTNNNSNHPHPNSVPNSSTSGGGMAYSKNNMISISRSSPVNL